MSRRDGHWWEVGREDSWSNQYTQLLTTPESPEVTALLVLALGFLLFLALGNLVGLW